MNIFFPQISCISNDSEIVNLFFGALVVGKIDYWIERSFDFIDNEKPEKPFERERSEVAKQDRAYRTSFFSLESEAKNQEIGFTSKTILFSRSSTIGVTELCQ